MEGKECLPGFLIIRIPFCSCIRQREWKATAKVWTCLRWRNLHCQIKLLEGVLKARITIIIPKHVFGFQEGGCQNQVKQVITRHPKKFNLQTTFFFPLKTVWHRSSECKTVFPPKKYVISSDTSQILLFIRSQSKSRLWLENKISKPNSSFSPSYKEVINQQHFWAVFQWLWTQPWI